MPLKNLLTNLVKRLSRVTIVHASFLAFALCVVVRAGYVQLWQRDTWRLQADRQHHTSQTLPAPRGQILDASGTVLVESRPLVELSIAPREIRHAEQSRIMHDLGSVDVPPAVVSRVSDTSRAWVPIPGRFLSDQVATITSLRGVHSEAVLERVPSPLVGLQGLIGHADADGVAVDGVELALDTLLHGTPGRAATMRDGRGLHSLSPEFAGLMPIAGQTVQLTIRLDLQDIAERALADAVQHTGARGGDIVVLDPRNGELLALASRRADQHATAATALTEPVEPGSTLKPFVAAALLALGRVQPDEVFNTYNGEFTMFGFKITDVHKAPHMTFREVIEYSSNIGMAQAAQRLTPREEYEALRDFGFGAPTGLPFPSEASGVLREPRHWTPPTQGALARGYEILVTPVQLAMAYGAIANGGELLQPALVKEIRDVNGHVLYHHERQVVRRAISKPIATQMRALLREVVDSGTATKADLSTYEVGGKSGTAKRTEHGKYVKGEYTATFVGLFPADEPQLVVLVKLDSPNAAAYYGGLIAAPVTKVVLQAALASSDAAIDRSKLHPRARVAPTMLASAESKSELASEVASEVAARDNETDGSAQYVLNVGHAAPEMNGGLAPRAVPDVRGLSARAAANALHRAGFRVKLVNEPGRSLKDVTEPAPGTVAKAGSLVRLSFGT